MPEISFNELHIRLRKHHHSLSVSGVPVILTPVVISESDKKNSGLYQISFQIRNITTYTIPKTIQSPGDLCKGASDEIGASVNVFS
jgi:hypothetical protein